MKMGQSPCSGGADPGPYVQLQLLLTAHWHAELGGAAFWISGAAAEAMEQLSDEQLHEDVGKMLSRLPSLGLPQTYQVCCMLDLTYRLARTESMSLRDLSWSCRGNRPGATAMQYDAPTRCSYLPPALLSIR